METLQRWEFPARLPQVVASAGTRVASRKAGKTAPEGKVPSRLAAVALTWARGTLVKILVADDDRDGLELVEALLSGWGHEVILAGDGNAAWEALQAPDAPRLA